MQKIKSDGGGGSNYYDLPKGISQLQDLIEYRDMNFAIGNIFKACYRIGMKDGTADDYDLRKMVFYALRELGSIENRKDYLTIADEIIGYQHEDIPQPNQSFVDRHFLTKEINSLIQGHLIDFMGFDSRDDSLNFFITNKDHPQAGQISFADLEAFKQWFEKQE